MHYLAGMVENLVQKSQFTLFWDLVPSYPPPPINENLADLGTLKFDFRRIPPLQKIRCWPWTYVETNFCIPRGYHLADLLCCFTRNTFMSSVTTSHTQTETLSVNKPLPWKSMISFQYNGKSVKYSQLVQTTSLVLLSYVSHGT